MSIIVENLKQAIIGESNAKYKYEQFANKADEENLPEIAHLFRAISSAETIHIKNHTKALSVITTSEVNVNDFLTINKEKLNNQVKDTKNNLLNAIEGEIYETKKMYKKFIKNSEKEGNNVSELTFTLARKAEKIHAYLFNKYLKLLTAEKPIQKVKLYVCQICGNVELEGAPQKCPICEHSQKFFNEF